MELAQGGLEGVGDTMNCVIALVHMMAKQKLGEYTMLTKMLEGLFFVHKKDRANSPGTMTCFSSFGLYDACMDSSAFISSCWCCPTEGELSVQCQSCRAGDYMHVPAAVLWKHLTQMGMEQNKGTTKSTLRD
eukprot:3303115-Amphidinium_carterae.1